MIIKECYSFGMKCPCTYCDNDKDCYGCVDMEIKDTSKLCDKAREYCERTNKSMVANNE